VKYVDELDFSVGKVQSTLPLARQLHPFIAVFTLVAIVILNATALFTIYEAPAMGIILLLITDTMNWKDIVSAIPGNLMLMICYAFALAAAMNKSGLGAIIGESFATAFVGHPYVQLLGIYLCGTIVTAVAPNSAAATIVFPIVTNMAKTGGFNVLAGIYCLMISASADFMTPFGYQVNLMIQKPGSYTFVDYIKLGLPVTLIGLFICPLIAMYVWPYVPGCSAGMNCTNATFANMTNST
jgi:di/tricarboxylate transporter